MRGAFVNTLLLLSRSIPVVLLLVIYWVGLFIGTHIPTSQLNPIEGPLSDKTIHFYAYAGLGFLATWSIARMRGRRFLLFLFTMVVIIVFGALDELSQPLVNRSCSFYDWVADALGAIFGGIFYIVLSWLLHSSAKNTVKQKEASSE